MQRNASVDGLRAIAILLVVGLHAYGWPVDGQLGVDLFFVLRGFLSTTLLLREHDRNGHVSLRRFYVRRIRRLLPALVVLLVVFCTVSIARGDQPGLSIFSAATGLGFSMNIVQAWQLHPLSAGLDHLWSLAAEDQFYLVWPAVLFLIIKGRRGVAVVVLVLAVAAMTIQANRIYPATIRIEVGPDTRAVGLPIGCLLAIIYASRFREHALRVGRWLFPVAAFLFIVIAVEPEPFTLFLWWDALFCVCCAVILLRALAPLSLTARLLALAPLAWLGRISYSLYLWHFPLLVWLGWQSVGGLRASVAVAISVGVAAVSYYFVEQPFLRRGRLKRLAAVPVLA